MNRKSGLIMVAVVTAIFSLIAILHCKNEVAAEETRIIRVYANFHGKEVTARVEPNSLLVRPGTVVIWNNWAKDEIAITFKEGATCDAATEAAAGFKYDLKSTCFVTTQYIPFGGTASVMFKEEGRFDYEIQLVSRNVKASGSISVKVPGTAE